MLKLALDYEIPFTNIERRLMTLEQKLARLQDFAKAEVLPLVEPMLLRHWETFGAAFHHKWAPWAPSTRLKRQKQGNAGKGLMRDSDNLFRSVFRDATAARIAKVSDGVRITFSTGVRYGVYHQVGTHLMPERQVFPYPFPKEFQKNVKELVREYLRA
jgi:hypothetical protein